MEDHGGAAAPPPEPHTKVAHNASREDFSLNTFRYKGLLNCAGEHQGELCWESADVRADPPRPLLSFLLFAQIFSLLKWPSKEKFPQDNDKLPNYFFEGNFAAPGAYFR